MQFHFNAEPAIFVERPNRFVVHARIESSGRIERIHCPNPGRMKELMVPGARLYVDYSGAPHRRTAYTLRFVEHPASGQLISLNTQLPNDLFAEALAQRELPPFHGYANIRREVSLASGEKIRSRIDFCLNNDENERFWVETKSATLVRSDGSAHFPDAPTLRGRRHLHELTALRQEGDRAAVVFIVQRPDAHSIMPNWSTDPDFGLALHQAQEAGVELFAYTCRLTTREMSLFKSIPVIATPPEHVTAPK